ncbi:cation efflux system protein CzcA [Sulfurihydrogenibium azorense Az-Fu1]|uniref:Cation efflux system protein CzcA n=1 Tax=Sulfurihydrogenibium azorense (strain DSM 15241 / OCM 825 / Az-Fu1) TaxID=204536 RepID=C1DU88_SULAA|nr:CusA/CzcA family heavy metal efflux RND transporter [Sulfurihydrogenibium azorense]ACN98692.1 cation efflux system protein CzcA [Sulfurihydrogenibium azorense Az-Fu1]
MIDLVLRYRLFVLFLLALVISFGIYSYKTLPIDTFPDPTPVQVNIYTEAPGLSAEEVESLITKKIETVMSGIKDVSTVRSVSLPGLSYISVFFKDGTDIYFARRLVMEKLSDAKSQIPSQYNPVMGPNSSGLGNVLIYALTSKDRPLTDLRTIQEWKIKPLIKSVDGVEEISQWGPEKAFLVKIYPEKLLAYGLSFNDVSDAVEKYGIVVPGGFSKTSQGDLIVRAVNYITSIEDIKNIPVKTENGSYIKLSDVADVEEGEVPNRRGALTLNGEEVQGNIVLKRVNVNTKDLVDRLYKQFEEIKKILPKDVDIKILYDQSYLTQKAVSTVEKALIEGIVLVFIAMIFYLGNVRSAILVVLSIPITLLMAFIFMKEVGLSGNLMSLSGLAIGIGLFADATVVVVENIFRHMFHGKEASKLEVIRNSVKEVFKPVVFAILIITAVFIPIFSFESVEGKYYKPLALTIIFALISSLIVAFIFMPALSYYFLNKPKSEETKIMEVLNEVYHKILNKALKHGKVVLTFVVVVFLFSVWLFTRIGTEFAPTLNEGSVLVKSFLNPNVSLEEAKKVASIVEQTAKEFPEVENAFSNIGRAEKGEPEEVNYIETFIILKPYKDWKNFKKREEFENILREKLKDVPGVSFGFTQPIQMRIDELLSGVKSTVAIKVFGDDLDKVNQIGHKIEEIVKSTKGAVDVETEAQSGKLQLKITPKQEVLAKYNIKPEELLSIVGRYFAGYEANYLKQGLITFPIVLRLPQDTINSIEKLSQIPITTKDGYLLTLSEAADIEITEGFFKIRHENGLRCALVQSNLEGRDLGGFIQELKQKIEKEVKLPQGYFIQFSGQFENQERAMKKLSIIIPIVILLIFMLLYLNYNSFKDALIVILNIPFATIGGIVSLYLSGFNLSVPAAIGFIAVFGIATLNGVVLISYIKQLITEGKNIEDAINLATKLRLRPILITATAASLGLLPILFSGDIGSETQKPIAFVVIGGIFTSTMLTLLILPVVYRMFNNR